MPLGLLVVATGLLFLVIVMLLKAAQLETVMFVTVALAIRRIAPYGGLVL
jgi:hypothetical protein